MSDEDAAKFLAEAIPNIVLRGCCGGWDGFRLIVGSASSPAEAVDHIWAATEASMWLQAASGNLDPRYALKILNQNRTAPERET